MKLKFKFVLFVITTGVFAGCSSSIELQSSFSDKIKIDGEYEDWGTSLHAVEDENIAVAFLNNDDYLYISFVTNDRNKMRKIITNGLTVWLESSSGMMGIRYPMKMEPEELMQMRSRQGTGNERGRPDENFADVLKGREDLQVINDEEMPLYTYRAEAGESFRAAINAGSDQLVYELRIPLRNNSISKRVFSENISELEITFKTGEIKREGMQRPGGGPIGGGRGGGMGGINRGGMRPGSMEVDFTPLDYAFKVKLEMK